MVIICNVHNVLTLSDTCKEVEGNVIVTSPQRGGTRVGYQLACILLAALLDP